MRVSSSGDRTMLCHLRVAPLGQRNQLTAGLRLSASTLWHSHNSTLSSRQVNQAQQDCGRGSFPILHADARRLLLHLFRDLAGRGRNLLIKRSLAQPKRATSSWQGWTPQLSGSSRQRTASGASQARARNAARVLAPCFLTGTLGSGSRISLHGTDENFK